MSLKINVGKDELVKFTAKLERLNKSAFPNAVRDTLNSAAFDVKKNTLIESSEKEFINRSKNFFKANSHVEMAKGRNLEEMVSKVGMKPLGGGNRAVDELEQQEQGGVIKKKSFIPLDSARTSKKHNKNVKGKARLRSLRNVIIADQINTRKTRSGTQVPVTNPREKFVIAAIKAGKGGLVLSEHKGKHILWEINSINRAAGGSFKLTGLYTYEENRSVEIDHPTHFMEKAAKKTHKKMDELYIKHAERQFKKALR